MAVGLCQGTRAAARLRPLALSHAGAAAAWGAAPGCSRLLPAAPGCSRLLPAAPCQNPKATKTYIFNFRLKFEPKTKNDPRIQTPCALRFTLQVVILETGVGRNGKNDFEASFSAGGTSPTPRGVRAVHVHTFGATNGQAHGRGRRPLALSHAGAAAAWGAAPGCSRLLPAAPGCSRLLPAAPCQNPKATKTYIFNFRLKFEPKTKNDPRIQTPCALRFTLQVVILETGVGRNGKNDFEASFSAGGTSPTPRGVPAVHVHTFGATNGQAHGRGRRLWPWLALSHAGAAAAWGAAPGCSRLLPAAPGCSRLLPAAPCQNPKATKTYIFNFRLKFEPKTKNDPRIQTPCALRFTLQVVILETGLGRTPTLCCL